MNTTITEIEEAKLATYSETIDYVVNYYKTHDRSISESGDCCYQNEYGDRCGHSICIIEDFDRDLGDTNATSLIEQFNDEIHLPQFRNKSKIFWNMIQKLHDKHEHWTPNESGGHDITNQGLDFIKTIKEKYNENN